MQRANITTDIFTFPNKENHVVYAPFRRLAFLANRDMVNVLYKIQQGEALDEDVYKNTLEFLKKSGIINGEPDKLPPKKNLDSFIPTAVTLFPTNRCNLRCTYCYASAGEYRLKDMDFETAKNAISLIVDNNLKVGSKEFIVAFHGGGEPFIAWDIIKMCVAYAKSLSNKFNLKLITSGATNAIMSSEQVEWSIDNLNNLSISLDGTPDIQNFQRPLINGGDSYPILERNLKSFDKAGFEYALRATITELNVHRMCEMVEFFHSRFSTKKIHFEPLFVCGRCLTTQIKAPKEKDFVENFTRASELAEKKGMKLGYSGLRLSTLTNTFCGACSDNFCVTPDGYVTSCFEVLRKGDPRSDLFFYGRYIRKKGAFQIVEKKRRALLDYTVEKMAFCRDCIAKWHCAGDCLSKVSVDTEVFGDRGNFRCLTTQEITKWAIIHALSHVNKETK